MNWSDKAREIAEKVCNVETLQRTDFASKIIYDDNGRLDLEHIRHYFQKYLEEAAIKGMEFECENWLNRPRKNQQTSETT